MPNDLPSQSDSSGKTTLTAKVVATPTPASWSQAYNAGNLFAAISISKTEDTDEEIELNVIGKELINSLEAEYFSLSEKDLLSIQEAIKAVFEKQKSSLLVSFAAISIHDDILYVFSYGKGKISLIRGEKIGTILKDTEGKKVLSASGRFEPKDKIILQTESFAKLLTNANILEMAKDTTINEAAESLSLKVHEHDEGASCVLLIEYSAPPSQTQEEVLDEANDKESSPKTFFPKISLPNISYLLNLKSTFSLNRSKQMLLLIVIFLGLIFIFGIYFTLKRQESAKTQALFENAYSQAEKKYEEGTALASLNKSLARDDFLAAKKILEELKPKLPSGGTEEGQTNDLLRRVNTALEESGGAVSSETKPVDDSVSLLLKTEKEKNAAFVAQDDKSIYLLDASSVTKIGKSGGSGEEIIKNDNNWKTPSGIGVYFGNVYVLDKDSDAILKFTAVSKGFGKTNYFASGTSQDLANATAMTIDGSIYILLDDGQVKKFTRGKPESFSLSGLDKPLSHPLRIATSSDMDNIYILDSGNSRIVVVGKDGSYKAQYTSGVIKTTKDFEVLEKDKKIFLLSEGKIYEMPLK